MAENFVFKQTGAELQAIIDAVETIDQTPTAGSKNPVESGGVAAALEGVETALQGVDDALEAVDTRIDGVDTRIDGVDTALEGKQATLVSGTNIKTINGESVLGAGDLRVGDANAVKNLAGSGSAYTTVIKAGNSESMTAEVRMVDASAKVQAAGGSVEVNASGVALQAGNSGAPNAKVTYNGQEVATKKYVDDAIEAIDVTDQIAGKADKVTGAVTGDFAGLDSQGNLTDSGKKASDFATAAQGVKADAAAPQVAVNAALAGKADKATTLAGYGITDAYTKTEVDAAVDVKQNSADIATINGSDITHGGNVTILAAEGQTITIDAAPTEGSNNAVSSGGTYNSVAAVKGEIDGYTPYLMPDGLKTLNWNQSGNVRGIYYADGELCFYSVSYAGCNIGQASTGAFSDMTFYIAVDTAFWDSDTPLLLDVDVDTYTEEAYLQIYFQKGSLGFTKAIFNSAGSHTFDIKQLLIAANQSTYRNITNITIGGMYTSSNNAAATTVRTKGFYHAHITGLRTEIAEVDARVDALEPRVEDCEDRISDLERASGAGSYPYTYAYGSALLMRESLPNYYTEQPADPSSYDDDAYIDVKVESIPDGKHFIFITDTHWDWGTNAKNSPKLISYIKNRAYIDTVIFGGDFINLQPTKYLAKQVLTDFAFHFLGVLGKDLLPVMGNHDTNMANSPDTDFETKYLPHNVVYDVLFREHRQGGNYWEDNEDTLTAMATAASFSADRLADLKAQAMMDYWWDDDNNKIRYIVHDTEKPHQTPMWELFENSTVPYMLWIYNVLCTTPEGYDVCFACHMIGIPNQAGLEANVPLRQISSLLMGLKTRTAKDFYASRPNANCEVMWPWTSHTLDFTQCSVVGKVFIIAGHAHEDGISIINQSASTYNNVSATLYDGQTLVDQTVVEDNNGCAIPVIWTTRDACGLTDTLPTMTPNSVTEQAFDVFSLCEGEIRLTRIGAGSDRVVYIKA